MSEIILQAKLRNGFGKGPSRRLRNNSQLPAVVYANGQETIPISVCPREMTKIMRGPLRRNSVIQLALENSKPKTVMVRERQIHPIRRELIHVDFVEINLDNPVSVQVPVILFGKSEAVTMGGKLDHVLQKMRISCLPTKIPKSINVDISNLGFGSTHTADIALPEGVNLEEKPRVVILTIKKPRGVAKEEGAEEKPAS